MSGRFITFEGGEGAGKSTQLRRLAARLGAEGGIDGRAVTVTREPGGSEGAEEIRRLVLGGAGDRWDMVTELLLIYAARRDHLQRTIWPALDAGNWVLCDRFEDSSRAYQGVAGGLGLETVDRLGEIVRGDFAPDLTLILDLPVSLGEARAKGRALGTDRIDARGSGFHEAVRSAFLALADTEPERCEVIDASADADAVEAAIWAAVSARFGL